MAIFILLTAEQADHVRGSSATDLKSILSPTKRQGEIFILNVLVLEDSAHAQYHEYLAALPQMDSSNESFPPEIE